MRENSTRDRWMPEVRERERLATGRKNEPIHKEKSGEERKSGRQKAGKSSGQLGPCIRTCQEGFGFGIQ